MGTTPSVSPILEDLDGDGHLDIVQTSANLVTILKGDGNGNFTTSQTFDSATTYTGGPVVGDLNNDGFLDVAQVAGTNLISLISDSSGVYSPRQLHWAARFRMVLED